MKKLYISILMLLFVSATILAQPKAINPFDQLLTLQKIKELSENDYINVVISELISYGNAFKYHEELLQGLFEVELTSNKLLLKILNNNKQDIEKKRIYKDIIRYDKELSHNANKFEGFKMAEFNYYVNTEKAAKNLLENVVSTNPILPFFQVQVKQKNNIFWDKNIMNGIVPSGQTRILNKQTTMNFLGTPNGQPGKLFFDPTDGTIIPDGDGQHAKLFITDKNWKRVIYCDKDFTPLPGQTRFKAYDNTNGANFQYPTSIAYGTTHQSSVHKLYVADNGASNIKVVSYNNSNYTITNNPPIISTNAKPF